MMKKKKNYSFTTYFRELFKYVSVPYIVLISLLIIAASLGISELYIHFNGSFPPYITVILILVGVLLLAILLIFIVKGRGSFISYSPNGIDQFLFIILLSSLGIHIAFSKSIGRYYNIAEYLRWTAIGIFILSFVFIIIRITLQYYHFKELPKEYFLNELIENKFPESQADFYIDEGCSGDGLDREIIVKEVKDYVFNPSYSKNKVIGITGKWGSGKSSLLDLAWNKVKEEKNDNKFNYVFFDCWKYNDERSLLIGMIEKIYSELKLGSLDRNFFAQVEALADSILNDNIKSDLISFIFPKKESKQIFYLIENTLKYSNKRFILVIDNLDRTSHENVIYVYKAISSVLRFTNLTYVCLFDENRVQNALIQCGYNLNYLNKVLDYKILIPLNDEHHLPIIAKKCITNYLDYYYKDEFSYYYNDSQIFGSVKYIDDPRDLRRFMNFLNLKLLQTKDLNISDLITLLVIKTIDIDLYNFIYQYNGLLLGDGDKSEVVEIIKDNYPEDRLKQIIYLLSFLFPKKFENNSRIKDVSQRPIENEKFFHFYFLDVKKTIIDRDNTYKQLILDNKENPDKWVPLIINKKNKCKFGDFVESYCNFIMYNELTNSFLEQVYNAYRTSEGKDRDRISSYLGLFLFRMTKDNRNLYLLEFTSSYDKIDYFVNAAMVSKDSVVMKLLEDFCKKMIFNLQNKAISIFGKTYYPGSIKIIAKLNPALCKNYLNAICDYLSENEIYNLMSEFVDADGNIDEKAIDIAYGVIDTYLFERRIKLFAFKNKRKYKVVNDVISYIKENNIEL